MSFAIRTLVSLFACFMIAQAVAQPITYQGQLQDGNVVYDGSPLAMEFRLFDSASGGTQVGTTITRSSVDVTDGLFQVQLDFGSVWSGGDRYLEVEVAGQTLSPRQKVTPVPLAISAVNDDDTTYSAGTALTLSGTTFSLDTVVTDARYWNFGGDSGTNPANDFLGTLDATPFEIRTDNSRHLRIEPSAVTDSGEPITANVLGGSSANSVATGVRGATIAGGGAPSGDTDPDGSLESPNQVLSHYGVVGGGYANDAGDPASIVDGRFAVIGGGLSNTASGVQSTVGGGISNTASTGQSTVGGGLFNKAQGGRASAVAGGEGNTAGNNHSVVGGGFFNEATGIESTVGGGDNNIASGTHSTVGGGTSNAANFSNSTVSGGESNSAGASHATVGGGASNTANFSYSTVGGGDSNSVSGSHGTVGGGLSNMATESHATVGGGRSNTAGSFRSTVGGGDSNTASGSESTVGGGNANTASGDQSAIGGGTDNIAIGAESTIGGGSGNMASFVDSTVGGGESNTASGDTSTVAGGNSNCAGAGVSFAAGNRAKVRPGSNAGAPGTGCNGVPTTGVFLGDRGTFVWADSQATDFVSTGDNQFLVRAAGGVGINTNDPSGQALRVNGTVQIDSLGAGNTTDLCLNASGIVSDCSASSVRYKKDVAALRSATELVERLRAVSFEWKESGRADIGLIAEEVAEVEPRLATYDDEGRVRGVKYRHLSAVLIAAFQEQQEEVEASRHRNDRRLTALEAENAELKARLAALESRVLEDSGTRARGN